eukprot:scpid31613/ scgid12406/ 
MHGDMSEMQKFTRTNTVTWSMNASVKFPASSQHPTSSISAGFTIESRAFPRLNPEIFNSEIVATIGMVAIFRSERTLSFGTKTASRLPTKATNRFQNTWAANIPNKIPFW